MGMAGLYQMTRMKTFTFKPQCVFFLLSALGGGASRKFDRIDEFLAENPQVAKEITIKEEKKE